MQPSRAALLVALPVALTACPSRPPPPTSVDSAAVRPAAPSPITTNPDPTMAVPIADQRVAAQGLNQLGADLYARLRTRPGNLALAPGSIALAFGMTEAGARGDTLAEMRRTLHATLDEGRQAAALGALSARWNGNLGEGVTARTANRLFGATRYNFEAPYLALTQSAFAAPLERVDFAQIEPVRQHINGWVAAQTMDKIRDLLPPTALSPDTRLVLVNAMYLHAPWATAFPAAATRDEPFYVGGATAAPVPTMSRTDRFAYAQRPGYQALDLPYLGRELAMTVLLPDARDGLAALEAQLTADALQATFAALGDARVTLRLPRFRVSTESIALRDELLALGMRLAFDRDRADFTGMANPPSSDDRLSISNAFHKVYVDVAEAGTEAAAATAVVMTRGGMAAPTAPPTMFVVDHPFVFVIRDLRTGAVLFLGRVLDPRPTGA